MRACERTTVILGAWAVLHHFAAQEAAFDHHPGSLERAGSDDDRRTQKMRRDVIVVSPNDPASSGFNVLSWIDPETPEADDNVASVVQWIAGDDQLRAGGGENHFFIS